MTDDAGDGLVCLWRPARQSEFVDDGCCMEFSAVLTWNPSVHGRDSKLNMLNRIKETEEEMREEKGEILQDAANRPLNMLNLRSRRLNRHWKRSSERYLDSPIVGTGRGVGLHLRRSFFAIRRPPCHVARRRRSRRSNSKALHLSCVSSSPGADQEVTRRSSVRVLDFAKTSGSRL